MIWLPVIFIICLVVLIWIGFSILSSPANDDTPADLRRPEEDDYDR